MNLKERNKYSREHQLIIAEYERIYLRKIYQVLIKQFDNAADILKERGVEALRSGLSRVVIDTEIGDVVRSLYSRVGIRFANKTYREIENSAREEKVKAGQISFNSQWAREILDYFRMYLINKAVVPITISSKQQIMQVLEQGIAEGWSIERMAYELTHNQRQLLLWRSRLIIRTETAKAAYYGRRLGERDSAFETQKQWISAHDRRTRHGHRDVDGETIDSSMRYAVPVYRKNVIVRTEMMFGPGDPEASAENVCNCRCTNAIVAKRDQNGRLMRKPTRGASIVRPNDIQRPITITI